MKAAIKLLTVFGGGGPLPAPTLTAPAAGAVLDDTTPEFSWSAVPGAATYDIEIRVTLTGVPTATGISGTTYTPSALSTFTAYSWRVRAVNAGGTAGAWSSTFSFEVDVYLFRDLFSDTVAAGAYNGTVSTPGAGARVATDTESKFSGDGSKFIASGGKATPVFSDPRVTLVPTTNLTRAAGKAIRTTGFQCSNTDTGAYVGFSASNPATVVNLANLAFRFDSLNRYSLYNGSVVFEFGPYAINTSYDMVSILRTTGCFQLVKGGVYGGSDYYALVYPVASGNASPLFLGVINHNLVFELGDIDVLDLTSTVWANAFGNADEAVASPSAGEEITANQDAVIEFTWTPQAGETLELSFRYQDADNRLYFQAVQAGSTLKLFQVLGGTATQLGSTSTVTWTAGTPYRFVLVNEHKNVRLYWNDAVAYFVSTSRFITNGNKVKVSLAGANLVAYPRYTRLNGVAYTKFDINRVYAKNAAAALTTATYDGSGEAVHPDVYDAGVGNTWNGHRYWMVATPYPNGDATKENPSIWVSDDKTTWAVPDGLTNPIVAEPGSGYNSDPDLTMIGSTLWCVFRYTNATNDIIKATSSTDGINWTAPVTLFTVDDLAAISPTVIYDGTQYRMFTVDFTTDTYPLPVSVRTAPSISGPWSSPSVVTMTTPANTRVWHLDVVRDSSALYALCYVQGAAGRGLYLGISYDWGDTWTMQSEPFMTATASPGWDSNLLYRGTIIRTSGGFDLWYSAARDSGGGINAWHIGYTPIVWNG